MNIKRSIFGNLHFLCVIIIITIVISACQGRITGRNREKEEVLASEDFSLVSNAENNIYYISQELSVSLELDCNHPSLRKMTVCGDQLAVLVSGLDEEYNLFMWVYYFDENGDETGHFNLEQSTNQSGLIPSLFTGYPNGELAVGMEDMNFAEFFFLDQQGKQTRNPLMIDYEDEGIANINGVQVMSNGDFVVVGSNSEGSNLIIYDSELKQKFNMVHKESIKEILESGPKRYISYRTRNEQGEIVDWLEEFDSETGVFKEKVNISDLEQSGSKFSFDGIIYSTSQTDITKIDLANKEIKTLLSWGETDVDRSVYTNVSPVCALSEGTFFILGINANEFMDNSILMLKQQTGNPFEGVKTLILGGFGITAWDNLQQSINQFNQSNDSYRIQLVDYYEGIDYGREWDEVLIDQRKAEQQMYLDVLSGKGPDIIYEREGGSTDNSLAHYERNGLLLDLYPLITADTSFNMKNLIPNVIAACEMESKLCKLVPHFSIKGFLGDPEIIQDRLQWTIAEFNQVASTLPERARMLTNKSPAELLEENLSGSMYCFIDMATKTSHFDSTEFCQVLEWAKTYGQEIQMTPDGRVYEEEWSLLISKQLVLFSDVKNNDLKQGAVDENALDFIGYPSPGRYKAYIVPEEMIAISSWSKNPEGCWEFIKYLLSYDYQLDLSSYRYYQWGFGYPISQEVMDAWCNFELHPELLPEDPNAPDGQESVDETEVPEMDHVQLMEDTQRRLDSCLDLIYSADTLYYPDPEIMNIIMEEVAYYFAGEKPVEDVAVIIQDRVQTLLNE